MQCPNDQTTLAMTERQGIEIDYCPSCRGVWLDKGELDKLISGSENNSTITRSITPQQHYNDSQKHEKQSQHYNNDQSYHNKKHKKESFLGDLFDF